MSSDGEGQCACLFSWNLADLSSEKQCTDYAQWPLASEKNDCSGARSPAVCVHQNIIKALGIWAHHQRQGEELCHSRGDQSRADAPIQAFD